MEKKYFFKQIIQMKKDKKKKINYKKIKKTKNKFNKKK
jgi:hypothetical protein